jgi:hypothetical protein
VYTVVVSGLTCRANLGSIPAASTS